MIWTDFKKEEQYIILNVQEVGRRLNIFVEEKECKTSKDSISDESIIIQHRLMIIEVWCIRKKVDIFNQKKKIMYGK